MPTLTDAAANNRSQDAAMGTMTYAAHAEEVGHEIPHGWRHFVHSTNHKDIGTMYLVFAIIAGVIGSAFLMRYSHRDLYRANVS